MLGPVTLAVTACTTAVGAFVQGLTSFGYAIVSWTAYSILIQLHVQMPDYHSFLVCLSCFVCVTVSVFNILQVRSRIVANLPGLALASVLEFPGNYAGAWTSHVIPVDVLRLVIGGIFVAMSLPRVSSELLDLAEGTEGILCSSPEASPKRQLCNKVSRHEDHAISIGRKSGSHCRIASEAADEDRLPAGGPAEEPSEVANAEEVESCERRPEEGAKAVPAEGEVRGASSRCRLPSSSCRSPRRFAVGLVLVGVTSGFCHGSVGIPGPPWMLFFAFAGVDKSDGRAVFAMFELIGGINFFVAYAVSGQIQREFVPLYVVVVLACAGGVSLGNRLHPHVSPSGAVLSLLILTLLSGLQALGCFDVDSRTGTAMRLLVLLWAALLACAALCRRRHR
eukprot:CAMPEP_0175554838 /NCGR_PEP_ID=MMETSP0096-20121207/34060_1 /TAXON_ID=311494 /ORGANISM="Alexandrium monilatum, Strain CCMP3105" /LENGTH=393 /DNA_ID=CAMNT_0016857957 /DNA_START=26 /DNA_END=1204 /DNA_ORIENTATION=+